MSVKGNKYLNLSYYFDVKYQSQKKEEEQCQMLMI